MSSLSRFTPSWSQAPFLVLGVFVAVQFTMVRLATKGFEGPDQVHYYKMGLEYSKDVQRQTVQRHLGWELRKQGQRLRFVDRNGQPLTGELTLVDRRPATRTQDRTRQLAVGSEGCLAPELPGSGQWVRSYTFRAQGQEWRTRERLP